MNTDIDHAGAFHGQQIVSLGVEQAGGYVDVFVDAFLSQDGAARSDLADDRQASRSVVFQIGQFDAT